MTELIQMAYAAAALASLERNLLPDAVIRRLTRLSLASCLRSGYKPSSQLQLSISCTVTPQFPLFFHTCYYFNDKSSSSEDAEEAMLQMYCEWSELKDGDTILDVGCGWGRSHCILKNCKNRKSDSETLGRA
ncbi:unnamed protein product [Citrullus colocynthis]|uniref:Uncharacterized protein n=1 Tax=Citrullus colocynthis TaxID=252529 RepID=A0ABP0YA34_9ROSI